MTEIYWFQHDLRLHDNPGLLSHCHAGRLLLVYCWPDNRPWCNVTGMGPQRRRFLLESLQALREELVAQGQDLLVLKTPPESGLASLVRQTGAKLVGTSRSPGYHERHTLRRVAAALPVPLKIHGGNTLFTSKRLPFGIEEMPGQFTPFKARVEGLPAGAVHPQMVRLETTTARFRHGRRRLAITLPGDLNDLTGATY